MRTLCSATGYAYPSRCPRRRLRAHEFTDCPLIDAENAEGRAEAAVSCERAPNCLQSADEVLIALEIAEVEELHTPAQCLGPGEVLAMTNSVLLTA
jgi:hypothetical protein